VSEESSYSLEDCLKLIDNEEYSRARLNLHYLIENGNGQACMYLAYLNELGLGTQDNIPDYEKAMRLYYQAFITGCEKAEDSLVRIYSNLSKNRREEILALNPAININRVLDKTISLSGPAAKSG
jgi:TPR repeat protein